VSHHITAPFLIDQKKHEKSEPNEEPHKEKSLHEGKLNKPVNEGSVYVSGNFSNKYLATWIKQSFKR
jgi:hypothetical protein